MTALADVFMLRPGLRPQLKEWHVRRDSAWIGMPFLFGAILHFSFDAARIEVAYPKILSSSRA